MSKQGPTTFTSAAQAPTRQTRTANSAIPTSPRAATPSATPLPRSATDTTCYRRPPSSLACARASRASVWRVGARAALATVATW
eukprot:1891549-Pleurochrysis_carterae.AAC.1